ncbi:MAG TPA: hypothetical protein VJX92_21980 [Methylomirabilota bacterium]|nr:hypothetical protein [Methylomirabilota bacterium]
MLTPEERASELTKWVAADLRPRQWTAIRDSFREALAEERAACVEAAQTAIRSFAGDAAHLEGLARRVAEAIRTREKSAGA